METKKNKGLGLFNERCNRMACQKEGATWFNYSNQAYYCPDCADLINEANHKNAIELYGHDLCIEGEHQNCNNCNKYFPIDQLKYSVDSVRHLYKGRSDNPLAMIRMAFLDPDDQSPCQLCEKCRLKLVRAVYNGGNWE